MLGNTTYHPQTETIARTPGVIATCAILVCSCSPAQLLFFTDRFFVGLLGTIQRCLSSGSGGVTMLESGLRRKKKTIVNIFKEWDAMIFPETDSSLAGPKPSKDACANLKVLMESVEGDNTDEKGDD
jgi:hypothetical protein